MDITKRQIDSALLRIDNGLNKYLLIQASLTNVDVSKDREFQKSFNHFYRIRRDLKWQLPFYKLLQEKKNKRISFKDALSDIKQKTGRLEASFASKLVATIHPDKPIIDKFVLENAGLKLPYSSAKNREARIISVYCQLQQKFKDFLITDNGKYLVKKFIEKYPKKTITHIKMADLVLWQTR
jgi:hypothetical protein